MDQVKIIENQMNEQEKKDNRIIINVLKKEKEFNSKL